MFSRTRKSEDLRHGSEKRKNLETIVVSRFFNGAAGQIRTADLILTKDALCLLSYSSEDTSAGHILYPAESGDPERARTVDLQRDRLAF